MGNERMTIGYDVTDDEAHGDNGNFHGDYISIKNRTVPPDNEADGVASEKLGGLSRTQWQAAVFDDGVALRGARAACGAGGSHREISQTAARKF